MSLVWLAQEISPLSRGFALVKRCFFLSFFLSPRWGADPSRLFAHGRDTKSWLPPLFAYALRLITSSKQLLSALVTCLLGRHLQSRKRYPTARPPRLTHGHTWLARFDQALGLVFWQEAV